MREVRRVRGVRRDVGRECGSERELGTDNWTDAGRKRRPMKTRRAIHAIAVEQRNRRVSVARRLIDERFRKRCGL